MQRGFVLSIMRCGAQGVALTLALSAVLAIS